MIENYGQLIERYGRKVVSRPKIIEMGWRVSELEFATSVSFFW